MTTRAPAVLKINGDVNRPTNRPTDRVNIGLFRKLENRKKAEICNLTNMDIAIPGVFCGKAPLEG